MENHYGIAVKNKYDLFLDDDCDPYEILKTQEEAKQKAKTDKTKKDAKNEKAKSGKSKTVKKPTTPAMDQPKGVDVNANKKDDQKPRGRGKPTEGERTGSARPFRESGNREVDRPPRRERQEKDRSERPPAEFRDRTDRPESGRGRGRGERGGRGRGGGRGARGGFDRFGKREFERHSGSDKTGVKAVDKRDGGGAHNWGTIKDEMEKEKASTEPLNDSVNEETAESPDTENQNPNAEPEEETVAEEEGPKEMTLDEWKAQQSQERKMAAFNIRKAGEGVDGGQWKKTFVLQKKQPEIESDEDESDEDEEEDPRQKKSLLNIEITFNDQPLRGRGGRRGRGSGERGRGGGRGRGGEGGDRGRGDRGERTERGGGGSGRGTFGPRGGNRGDNRNKEVAPHIEDENDFPSLGAK